MEKIIGAALTLGSSFQDPQALMHASMLPAIGLKHKVAHGSMIMALCRQNSMKQVAALAEAAEKTVKRRRALFPL